MYRLPDCAFCSSEKINGNKTSLLTSVAGLPFCSSEKINGNKTRCNANCTTDRFCSSEKINGNKTGDCFNWNAS